MTAISLAFLSAVKEQNKNRKPLKISMPVTISAVNRERRGITLARADRKCVEKQIKDGSCSGETSDNLLSLETQRVRMRLGSPVSEKMNISTHL